MEGPFATVTPCKLRAKCILYLPEDGMKSTTKSNISNKIVSITIRIVTVMIRDCFARSVYQVQSSYEVRSSI